MTELHKSSTGPGGAAAGDLGRKTISKHDICAKKNQVMEMRRLIEDFKNTHIFIIFPKLYREL